MKKKYLMILLAGIMTASVGCKKEGPAGPAGPQGEQGPPGKDGSANVDSKVFYGVTYSYSGGSWNATIQDSRITQDVVDNGVVLTYVKVGNGYNQIPLTVRAGSNITGLYQTHYESGRVDIFYSYSDGLQYSGPGTDDVKVVVIPSASMVSNIDVSNYSNVKDYFNLKD